MLFDQLDNRSSEDHADTIKEINGLIIDGRLSIDDVLIFFNYGCGAYRTASSIVLVSESKINIEFNYAARAFASYIKCASAHDDQGAQLALLDAFQASRHIVNDSLDIILFQLSELIEASDSMSEHTKLHHLITDYSKKIDEKDRIQEIVAKSRRLRGTFRYEEYLKIIQGEAYTNLLHFLNEVKAKTEKLVELRQKEQDKNKRNVFLVWITCFVGLFGTIAVGLFPEEAKLIGLSIKSFLGFTKTP